MENLLSLVENPCPQVLDEEKLKFSTSKILIWDYFSMHKFSDKSLNTEEKTALLKWYYVELDSRYYGKKTSNFCSLLPTYIYFCLVSVIIFSNLIWVLIVLKILFPEKNVETSIVATKLDDKNGQVSTFTRVWPIYGYFN